MANFLVCSILFRVVMPLILLTCIVFRPCILSGIYLLFTLVSASVPVPTPETMNGATGIYLKILIMLSTLTSLGQLIFQCLLLLKYTPYGEILNSCGFLERLLRHAGFVRLDQLDVQNILVWVTPEVVMFLASIAFFITFKKLVLPIETHSEEEGVSKRDETQVKNGKNNFFLALGKYLTILAFCVAAIFKPSVIGGFYFLVFLSSATWWSCNKQLSKCFGVFLKICMGIVVCHIFTLYTYQTQWPQEFLDANSTYARYFGLSVMLKVNCDEPRSFIYEETIWTDYANVVALLLLYFIIAMESKQLLQTQPAKKQGTFSRLEGSFKGPLSRQLSQRLSDRRLRRTGTSKNRWQSATRKVRSSNPLIEGNVGESTPLLHRAGVGQKYGRGKGTILQDSTGSVIVNNEDALDDIPMENIENAGNGVADDEPSIFEQTVYILESILLFVIRTSYIATNIIMMAWSITYHSWLTFVLLLWANILWMVPNQRKFMLRSSPFLVLYAWFLLISAYIYSMNLTDEELPVTIYNIDLAQIGFQKIRIMACTPLFIKCLFTTMFWITLKQYVKEREDARNISVLADMTAPLQISIGAVTVAGVDALALKNFKCKQQVYPENFNNQPQYLAPFNEHGADSISAADESTKKKDNEILTRFGNVVRGILTRFWIWIVAITLFFVAITGERMTSFRILYMALFLTFILSFQVSFRAWRKIMFAFWITVIVYSMLILVLVYTYQFNHFADYWRDYLHVSEEQQLDIGLEKYDAKQLFVRLVTPTFFVIITVIQVHYFHKDFLELSKPNYRNIMDTTKSEANSSAQGGIKMMDDDDEENEDGQYSNLDLTDIENVSVKVVQKKFYKFLTFLYEILNLFLLFLEIHMPKFVLLMAMVVCLMDTCALYLIVIVFIVLGASIGKSMLNISIYWSSFIVSILMLLRMVYQIKYIDHDIWNVNCTVNDKNLSMNDAEWLGFRKVPNGRDLPEMVKWNIVFIIIVTLWCVLKVRQINFRAMGGDFLGRPFFMFPHIKVGDSHRNLKTYLKYLANYFYYRLGVEISLIGIVATIGFRMDMYALMYAIWLCILFSLNRTTMAKVWNVFLIFIAFVISIQYIMVIGLPPSLCISFPWDSSDFLRRLQEWAYLMSATTPPPAKKIMCDFILLLLVSRQALVFRIERRYGDDYTGGSNDSIIHNAEDQNFVIPIPDFVTYSRTYLDILKKAVFLPFMWITLAIVFLAGTNRVNLFSIGYLLGSFYFLWQGSDIYLRQIPRIIQKWNVLISYNVAVITVKALLQLVGCIFIEYLEADCCWLIQLLGISCVRKFKIPGSNGGAFDGNDCTVPPEYIGLAWDGACFACLVFQKRLFQSYSFFHIINDNKASAILATRGAELIEELRQKRMVEQDEEEKKIIEKIKMKMDKIKANQQKILGPNYQDSENHYVDRPPLAHCTSMSSYTSATSATTPAGYHTPIEEEEEQDGDPAPLTPAAGSSLIQPNAPSPFSAINSLEGYLEPQRMSFSSPPNSELNPRPPSPDESFPVFSPPPYDDAPPYAEAVSDEQTTVIQRQHSLGPHWMAGSLVTPRQSVISYSSRSPMSHHTYSIFPKSNRPMYRRKEPKHYKAAIRSGDYYMFDDLDNEELDLIEDNAPIDEDDDEIKARRRSKKFTLGELLSATLKTDVGTAIRLEGGGVGGPKRRVSLPPLKRDTVDSQFSAPLSAPPAVHVKDEDDEDEPQPSTSRETQKDAESKKSNVHKYQKILDYVLFVFAFIESFMLSAITYLNKYTKDYRYVLKVLSREKKILKESTEYNVGIRLSPNYIWQPASTHKALLMKSEMPDTLSSSIKKTADSDESDTKPIGTSPLPYSAERDRRKASVYTIPEIRILAPSMERGLDSPGSKSTGNEIYEYDTGEMSSYDQPTILRLILAVWYIILSHSDLFCYFIIFLNQIKNATFMSLPLPLMVFFWGTLTVPRPSKTFWVTIIAYTQIIVVIKCVFQFDILPWTSKDYSSNINSASLIGIERKKDYAVWDLLLLLVVYFHRYMLKCLGLWKTTFVSIAALADGEYSVEDGELVPMSSDQTLQNAVSKRKESDLEHLVDDSETEERVELRSIELSPQEMWPASLPMVYYSRMTKYVDSMKHFFQQLFDPGSRVATDVYSYMFLCDFFNFFVILIGYSSFGSQQGDGGVSSYLEDNRVPVLFLLMLILQFLIIIVDRAIFLRKNIFAKIVFQFLQILILHIWLFVIFPVITERKINLVIPPQMYYMVKCFYLLLSAYQIRSGYPSRILGNFLCKGYNYVNMFLFKGFMLIPFLFELRTVMDWMWTDTSMTVFDFIKMEDIFAHIFQLKCTRHIESEYPQPRGEKKKPLIKYLMGGGLLVIIIGIIWFPLVFFSLGNAVGEPNPPYDVTVDLKLGPYESLYRMTAQTNNIYKFKENDFHVFQQLFTKHKGAQTFLSNYEFSDLAAVKLSGDSATVWSISPPDHDRLVEEVESNNTLTVHLTYQISHKSNSKEDPGIMRDEIKLEIPAFEDNKTNPIRQNLLNMLKKNKSEPVLLTYIMPKFVKVTSRGTVQILNQFMLKVQDEKDTKLRNITLMLESDPTSDKVWWNILEQVDDENYKHILQNLPYADKNSFIIYTFNDKIFPATLSIITGGGIIGLYTTLVFVASRLLRGFFSEICFKIMFDDMPYVDRVLQLCLDIYLVREAREFCLEEDLFAKLVFLYRSPETLIKWTRPKEELDDEDDPEGDDNQ